MCRQALLGEADPLDFTPFLVPKSSRTVWFASVRGVNVVLCFTPSTTPNGALFGDHDVICMSPAEDRGPGYGLGVKREDAKETRGFAKEFFASLCV